MADSSEYGKVTKLLDEITSVLNKLVPDVNNRVGGYLTTISSKLTEISQWVLKEEQQMGLADEAITKAVNERNELQVALNNAARDVVSLQNQLTAAQQNQYDSSDIASIDAELSSAPPDLTGGGVFGPSGPSAPSGPSGPSGPSTPSTPTGPSTPSSPTGASSPTGPSGPSTPATPTGPSGPSSPSTTGPQLAAIQTANGEVLATPDGYALYYTSTPDSVDTTQWTPFIVTAAPTGIDGLDVMQTSAGLQATWDANPLYTYVQDQVGTVNGNDIGGVWTAVIVPGTAPTSPSSPSSPSGPSTPPASPPPPPPVATSSLHAPQQLRSVQGNQAPPHPAPHSGPVRQAMPARPVPNVVPHARRQ